MKIAFLLPGSGQYPIGGFKIAYQYADGLAGRGHDVTVIHPSFLSSDPVSLKAKFRGLVLSYLKQYIRGSWRPNSWFTFRNRVRLLWIPTLNPAFLPKADVYVATWWHTAELLAAWNLPSQKLYLIQHYEIWGGPKNRVDATWQSDLKKIVIAKWLMDIAVGSGQQASYVPNALDATQFGCDVSPVDRANTSVAMLSHQADWKGTADGIKALKLARQAVPQLTVEMFGVGDRPASLPPWITYFKNPDQMALRGIYNRAAIFVSPSWEEGWPLPPAEAMTCGAALVATNIGGHREYCIDEVTALLAPARAPEILAEKIILLIEDTKSRNSIAENGLKFMARFTWDHSLDCFEHVLNGNERPTQNTSIEYKT